jgi:membrane protease YdiL (CAAX protease family)
MKLAGKTGNYLAGGYMLGPALAALITRWFFYEKGFKDARFGLGRWKDYTRFWGVALIVIVVSYAVYTILGAITWDISGETFLSQLEEQMALSGKSIDDLPAGMTPRIMLVLFFAGGLTVFNIPMIVVGFGEEFGWRGLMFPLLCRKRLAFGIIIGGLIWFGWHIPLTFVLPHTSAFTIWQQIVNGAILAIGSICTFVFFAYVYVKTGSIWVVSFVHAVFNNGSRSFSYFVNVEDQLLANLGLSLTMLAVVVFMLFRRELDVFGKFFAKEAIEE